MTIEQLTALRDRCTEEFRQKASKDIPDDSPYSKCLVLGFVEAFSQGFETAWMERDKIENPQEPAKIPLCSPVESFETQSKITT